MIYVFFSANARVHRYLPLTHENVFVFSSVKFFHFSAPVHHADSDFSLSDTDLMKLDHALFITLHHRMYHTGSDTYANTHADIEFKQDPGEHRVCVLNNKTGTFLQNVRDFLKCPIHDSAFNTGISKYKATELHRCGETHAKSTAHVYTTAVLMVIISRTALSTEHT